MAEDLNTKILIEIDLVDKATDDATKKIINYKTKIAELGKELSKIGTIEKETGEILNKSAMTWTDFVKGKMGPYMKELGGHGPAIKKIGEEWKAYKETLDNTNTTVSKTIELTEKELKKKIILENEIKALNKEIRNNETIIQSNTRTTLHKIGSMNALSLELGKNRTAYRNLSEAERNNSKVGGELLRTIQQQDAQIKKLDATIGNHQRKVGDYAGAIKGFGSSLVGALGIGVGIASVVNFFKTSFEGYKEQAKAEKELMFALKERIGSTQELIDLADELQKNTGIPDDAIIKAEAFLATQGRSTEEIKKTIKAGADLSKVLGVDIDSAVRMLDASLEGQTKGIARLDSGIKDLSKTQLENGEAIDLLGKKYEGFAASSMTGLDKLKVWWNEFGDGVGEFINQFGNDLGNIGQSLGLGLRNMLEPIIVIANKMGADFDLNVLMPITDYSNAILETDNRFRAFSSTVKKIGIDNKKGFESALALKEKLEEVYGQDGLKVYEKFYKEQIRLAAIRKAGIITTSQQTADAEVEIEKDKNKRIKDEMQEMLIISNEIDQELYQKELIKIKEKHERDKAELEWDREMNIISNEIDIELANKEVELEKEKNAKIKADKEQQFKDNVDRLNRFQSVVGDFQNALSSFMDAELIKAGDNEKEKDKIRKKYADRNANIAILQATIQGARGVMDIVGSTYTNTMADIVLKAAAIAGVVATTAGQITVIQAQRKQIKSMHTGGFTGEGGQRDSSGHKVAGVVHGGEWVAKKSFVQSHPRLFNNLQSIQERGYATGGFVTSQPQIDIRQLIESMPQPVVLVQDIMTATQRKVKTIDRATL